MEIEMDHDPSNHEPASTRLDELNDKELAALHADLDAAEEELDRLGCVPYAEVRDGLDKFYAEFEAEQRDMAKPRPLPVPSQE